MKKIFIAIILIFPFSVFGQETDKIICDLQVEILPNYLLEDSAVFSIYSNICKISQSFHCCRFPYEKQIYRPIKIPLT